MCFQTFIWESNDNAATIVERNNQKNVFQFCRRRLNSVSRLPNFRIKFTAGNWHLATWQDGARRRLIQLCIYRCSVVSCRWHLDVKFFILLVIVLLFC